MIIEDFDTLSWGESNFYIAEKVTFLSHRRCFRIMEYTLSKVYQLFKLIIMEIPWLKYIDLPISAIFQEIYKHIILFAWQ